MLSCEEMELNINLYLDGMLPSEELRPLNEHLEKCQACRERLQQLCAIKEALELLEEPTPEGLHERILDYVEKNGPECAHTVPAEPKILRPRRWIRALSAVAACAVIAVVAARFVPTLPTELSAPVQAAPDAIIAEPAPVPQPAPEIATEAYAPVLKNETAATPAPPLQYSIQAPQAPAPTEPMVEASGTGQLAEDLPPLGDDSVSAPSEEPVSFQKWLRADGARDALPEWVDVQHIYLTELDGETFSYVEIAVWAEDYWRDQLGACGFTVEEMQGYDLDPEGESLLLFFFWTE